ncbi:unnamed protein product [Effrenium voratum]|nr:unnamed protein product [Effrenium voratum]
MEVRVGADQRPGLPAGLHNAEPAPSPARQRALQERSQAEREYGLTPELHQDTWLQERIRASEREYGLDLPLEQRCALADAGARRLLERHSPSRPQSAAPAPPARRMPSLNHPTAPEGPRFLMKDSYWEQRQGERIREQREALHRRGVLRDEEEVKVPAFKAKPVPATVYTPRLQAAQCTRRSRSVEGEDTRGPFRARPVPWRVSAPLYDQIMLEEQETRKSRQRSRSLRLLRSASLPPRLEAEASRREQAQEPRALEAWHGEPYSARRWRASEAQKAARDVGRTLGLSEPQRPERRGARSAPRSYVPREPPTTEVPDFAARHERNKQQMERRKYQNRYVTQPEPFVFNAPKRSQSRNPPMAKDPTMDWRFQRARGQRMSLEPPPPPRTTQKELFGHDLAKTRLHRPF